MTITLATLEQATKQEVFDQVAKHLLTQNARSTKMQCCSYRGVGGLKCAAGCLIADSEYDHDMEGSDWLTLVKDNIVPKNHVQLISRLQDIHDIFPVESWESTLQVEAKRRRLAWNIS
jgi:hypothetical protein